MSIIQDADHLLNAIFGLPEPRKPRPLPAEDGKMDKVLATYCKKHDASIGDPCFKLEGSVTRQTFYHVCNARAKRAGFHARISEGALTFRNKGKTIKRRPKR